MILQRCILYRSNFFRQSLPKNTIPKNGHITHRYFTVSYTNFHSWRWRRSCFPKRSFGKVLFTFFPRDNNTAQWIREKTYSSIRKYKSYSIATNYMKTTLNNQEYIIKKTSAKPKYPLPLCAIGYDNHIFYKSKSESKLDSILWPSVQDSMQGKKPTFVPSRKRNYRQLFCPAGGIMAFNPYNPASRTILYFSSKNIHAIEPSNFDNLKAAYEYIMQLRNNNVDKPGRINFIRFEKVPATNLSISMAKSKKKGSQPNYVIMQEKKSICLEEEYEKSWIPIEGEVTCSVKDHANDSHLTKIPIKKDSLIEENVIPNKSILDIINSIDTSTVIIHKDLYITDRIIRQIKEEGKSNDKKQDDTKQICSDTKNNLKNRVAIVSGDKAIILPLNDFKTFISSLKDFFGNGVSNIEHLPLASLFSLVGTPNLQGFKTTDIIKKATAIIAKEKYQEKFIQDTKAEEQIIKEEKQKESDLKKKIVNQKDRTLKPSQTKFSEVNKPSHDNLMTENFHMQSNSVPHSLLPGLIFGAQEQGNTSTKFNETYTHQEILYSLCNYSVNDNKKPFDIRDLHTKNDNADELAPVGFMCESKLLQDSNKCGSNHTENLETSNSSVPQTLKNNYLLSKAQPTGTTPFECASLVDKSVRCLMSTKGGKSIEDGNKISKGEEVAREKKGTGSIVSSGVDHVEKTSINIVKKNDTTDISVSEKEIFKDKQLPVSFSTETSFQIFGSNSAIQKEVNALERVKNALASSAFKQNKKDLKDLGSLGEKKTDGAPNSRSGNSSLSPLQKSSLNSNKISLSSETNENKQKILDKPELKNVSVEDTNKKVATELKRIREEKSGNKNHTLEFKKVRVKVDINRNLRPESKKVSVQHTSKLSGGDEKKSHFEKDLKKNLTSESKEVRVEQNTSESLASEFKKVGVGKDMNKNLTPVFKKASDETTSKSSGGDGEKSNFEKDTNKNLTSELNEVKKSEEGNYVHLLGNSESAKKSPALGKKPRGITEHKSLSRRDKKILKEILKGNLKNKDSEISSKIRTSETSIKNLREEPPEKSEPPSIMSAKKTDKTVKESSENKLQQSPPEMKLGETRLLNQELGLESSQSSTVNKNLEKGKDSQKVLDLRKVIQSEKPSDLEAKQNIKSQSLEPTDASNKIIQTEYNSRASELVHKSSIDGQGPTKEIISAKENESIESNKSIPQNSGVFKKSKEVVKNERNVLKFQTPSISVAESKSLKDNDFMKHKETFKKNLIERVKIKIETKNPINYKAKNIKALGMKKLGIVNKRLKVKKSRYFGRRETASSKKVKSKYAHDVDDSLNKNAYKEKIKTSRQKEAVSNKLVEKINVKQKSNLLKDKESKKESVIDSSLTIKTPLKKPVTSKTPNIQPKVLMRNNPNKIVVINQTQVSKGSNSEPPISKTNDLKTETKADKVVLVENKVHENIKTSNTKIEKGMEKPIAVSPKTDITSPEGKSSAPPKEHNLVGKNEINKMDRPFPMLLIDLDKMTKEIKPFFMMSQRRTCNVPLEKIKDFPQLNLEKTTTLSRPQSVLQVSPSKDSKLNQELALIPSVSKIMNVTLEKKSKDDLKNWWSNIVKDLGDNGFKMYYKGEMTKGKQFHNLVQDQLLWGSSGGGTPSSLCFQSVHHVLEDIKDLAAVNSHVVHSKLSYRGVVDCVATYKKQPVVIEWKRLCCKGPSRGEGALSTSFEQLAAYIGALNYDYNYNFQVKEGLLVLVYCDGSKADVIHLKENEANHYWKLWLQKLVTYQNYMNKKTFKQ